MNSATIPQTPPDDTWSTGIRAQMRRSVILGIVGYLLVFAVAAATLANVNQQISSARSQLLAAQQDLAQVQEQHRAADAALAKSKGEADALRAQLNQIFSFRPHVVRVDAGDEKAAYGPAGQRGLEILTQAIRDVDAGLRFNGANTREVGFTSPGYAAYLLDKVQVRQPINAMMQRSGPPQNGDVIIYDGGYTMFYYDLSYKKFVIGMTPQGVLALAPDFAPQQYIAILPR